MDPITLIVTALAAGAASALQDDAKDAVKAAYARLRNLVKGRVGGRQDAEYALERHEAAPRKWEPVLKTELSEVHAERDTDLVGAAEALMALIDGAGARAGRYNITISGGQGIQIGDHNTQTNTF